MADAVERLQANEPANQPAGVGQHIPETPSAKRRGRAPKYDCAEARKRAKYEQNRRSKEKLKQEKAAKDAENAKAHRRVKMLEKEVAEKDRLIRDQKQSILAIKATFGKHLITIEKHAQRDAKNEVKKRMSKH